MMHSPTLLSGIPVKEWDSKHLMKIKKAAVPKYQAIIFRVCGSLFKQHGVASAMSNILEYIQLCQMLVSRPIASGFGIKFRF